MKKQTLTLTCLSVFSAIILCGCYTKDINEINRLREIEEPALKCPQLITYLNRRPFLTRNPARLAQEALVECKSAALPFLKAQMHKDGRHNDRARALMLEARVEILGRGTVKLLVDIAIDAQETPKQRATALDLLRKLNAHLAAPTAENLYLDETQPKTVRKAAERAWKALK